MYDNKPKLMDIKIVKMNEVIHLTPDNIAVQCISDKALGSYINELD